MGVYVRPIIYMVAKVKCSVMRVHPSWKGGAPTISDSSNCGKSFKQVSPSVGKEVKVPEFFLITD